MSTNKFELDTDDVLGFAYSEYISNMRGMAIAQPAKYFQLRSDVMKTVKRDAVGSLYKSIFNILSKGTDLKGASIGALGDDPRYIPHYPSQKINDFAIEVAASLADSLNKVVDILMPDDFEKLASQKLLIKGKSSAIDI